MSLITVQLPSGMFKNGTYYDAKNRWADGNRVRWHNNAMRPIGGWQRQQDYAGVDLPSLSIDETTTVFRDGFSWVGNTGDRYRVWGANDTLTLWNPDDTLDDITPAGFVGSVASPTVNNGYGSWLYGRGTYGSARPIDPTAVGGIWRWDFDTWGEDLIAGPSSPAFRGKLYHYDVSVGSGLAVEIANAPDDISGFVVTDQRIIMSIGSDTEARIVRWCDREDFDDWTPTQLNYAGDYFLQGNGALVDIQKVLDHVLILSETDAHVSRWLGAPLVYGFTRVGDDCGPWNGSVCYVGDRFAMWPGRRTFWMYDGTLRPVNCEVMDYITDTLNPSSIAKAFVLGIPQYNEIWWFYQSKTSLNGDVDTYVSYDYIDNTWSIGKIDRTAGISGEVYTNPSMVDFPDQFIFQHELADVIVDDAYAETGPLELGQGEVNKAVRYIYPDTKTNGDVSFTLLGQNMPTDPKYAYGPYAYNNPIPTRAIGRSVSMRIDGGMTPNWKVGLKTRFDVAPMGVGRR